MQIDYHMHEHDTHCSGILPLTDGVWDPLAMKAEGVFHYSSASFLHIPPVIITSYDKTADHSDMSSA